MIKPTGLYATEAEVIALKQLAKEARETSVVSLRLDQNSWAEMAREVVQNFANSIAKAHGLPDSVNYGVNGQTREILGWEELV